MIHQHLRRTTLSFGILSGSALPKIPGFLMSLQGMDATVEMKLVSADMREDGRRLRNAFDAHVAIFKNVLRFHRVKGLHFDRAIENNAFYVVPMKLTQIASLAATSGKRSTGTTSEWKIDWQVFDYAPYMYALYEKSSMQYELVWLLTVSSAFLQNRVASSIIQLSCVNSRSTLPTAYVLG